MQEIELKLELDPVAIDRIKGCRWPADFRVGRPVTRSLRTIYFDTVDFDLAEAGLALRLRKAGRKWVQTVKLSHTMSLGLSKAEEHTCPAPGGRLALDSISDPAVKNHVLESIDGAPLAPVFETRIQRTERRIQTRSSVIDLVIDVGSVVAETREAPLHELEIELVQGDPAHLFDVLRAVLPKGGLKLSPCSKAARGMSLALRQDLPVPDLPQRAARVPLEPSETINQAIAAIAGEVAGQISTNHLMVQGDPSPDGLKQLRIGLRRLRSLLRLFKREIDPARAAWLNAEARWLAAEIATVRDLDVMLDDILLPELVRHPDSGLEKLRTAFARRRQAALKRLRPLLAGERAQSLVIDAIALAQVPAARRGRDPVICRAPKLLERRWRKVVAMAEVLDELDIEQRHELRKELKKMRYSVEYLRALYPDETLKPFLKLLKRLQTVFGDLNDAAMAEMLLTGAKAPLGKDIEAQRAAGRLIGARWAIADLSWERAGQYWADLESIAPFWRASKSKKEMEPRHHSPID